MSPTWIVCENMGHWVAAMRIALNRAKSADTWAGATPRIQEVRTLSDLEAAVLTNENALGFVEVKNQDLAAVLPMLAKHIRRNVQFVTLLDCSNGQVASAALMEAGALYSVNASRNIASVFALADRYCARRCLAVRSQSEASITEVAWAALPWQDV